PQRTVAKKPEQCSLSVASLLLSLASVLIGPFGFIPGIICGHLAKARLRKEPQLTGRGMASAGLAIGYSFAVLITAAGVVFGVWMTRAAAALKVPVVSKVE